MIYVKNDTVYLTKGDDGELTVNCIGIDDETYEMQDGDSLILTVSTFTGDTGEVLMTVTSDSNTILIPHDKSDLLDVGRYSMDIEMNTADGMRYTIFPDYKKHSNYINHDMNWENFYVMPEVTRHV